MKCSKCGFENPKGLKLCSGCGESITLSEDRQGESINATVLSANISGFIKSPEKLSPGVDTDITSSLFENLREIVYKYEGTVEKFTDDYIMVLFGARITHEDAPERAVYSALEMLNALDRFNEEYGMNLSINIGVNSGVMIVDRGYTTTGDPINLAGQLMQMATDDIMVSESVYKSTAYLFEMDILKPVSIKKRAGEIIPYRVIGTRESPMPKHGAPELCAPLIGRDKEFKVMKLTLDKVMKAKSVVLSVNGEAGVGKSRLIEEFKKSTHNKVNWLSGRCLSYGKTFPFWVFLEQIRSYLGLSDFDLELESKRKLGGKAEDLFKERLDEYLPYLCVFLSIKVLEHLREKVKYLDPESLRLQEFISIQALFRDIAKNKPLILYFEDMHWIDPESLELLKFLLDGLKDAPIFFLIETRPEQETGLYNIRESIQVLFKEGYTEIDLKTLSANNAKTLIQNLLKMPEHLHDVSSLILEKSEGNPFYIEEIVRSFIESGVLKRNNGGWQITKDISSFEVPDTVDVVIRSRIDRLPHEAKEVLGRASVIGKSFPYKILSSISGKNHLRKNLNFLEDREFIVKKTDSSSTSGLSPDTEYRFRHILIRDVAYKGLLQKKRKEIHRKIAGCIEDIFKEKIEDYYELLAYHYYNAESFEKSYDYYKKAGDEAKERYSNNIAIECYVKAIEIHKELFPDMKRERLAELFERMGDVKELRSEYDEALKDYKNAFGYYTDTEKKAGIKRKMGDVFAEKNKYDKAISSYEKVIRMLKNIPKSPVLSETLLGYAFLLFDIKGNYQGAEKMIEQALMRIEWTKAPQIYARGIDTLGYFSWVRGNYDTALKYRKKALAIFEKLSDKRGIASALCNIGNVSCRRGESDTALRYYKKSLAVSEEIGDKKGIARNSNNIGHIYERKGEFDTALKYYEICFAISEEIGFKRGTGIASSNIGLVYREKAELDTALKYYKRYLAISEEIGDKSGIGVAFNNIGDVYHNKGKLDTALKYYKRDLAISEETGDKSGIGDALCSIGIVYKDRGKLDAALKYYKKALIIFNEIGYKSGIGIARRYIGELHTEVKRFDDAKEYLEGSEKILTEIGDRINLSKVYASLSHLNTVQEDYETALTFAEKALTFVKETGARYQEVIALRTLGKALSTEKSEKAISYLKQSISLAKKQKMQLEFAISSYELAKVIRNTKEIREAEKYTKEAKGIFKKSGANGWLKKVEGLTKEIEEK